MRITHILFAVAILLATSPSTNGIRVDLQSQVDAQTQVDLEAEFWGRIKRAARSVSRAVKKAAKAIKKTAEDVGKAITGTAKDAMYTVVGPLVPKPPARGESPPPSAPKPGKPVNPSNPTEGTTTEKFIDMVIGAGAKVLDVFATAGIPYKKCKDQDCMNPLFNDASCVKCMGMMN